MRKSLLFICLALTACSSVSVVEEKENVAFAPKSAPVALCVRAFTVSKGARFDVAPPRGVTDARESTGRAIAEGIMSRGARWVAPTGVLGTGEKPPREGLLVEGTILRAEQGSRALRIGIGFGAGRTRLDTAVNVFNLGVSAKKPWLSFKTTGGSNMEPGVVTGLVAPASVAVPLVATIAGTAVSGLAKGNKGVSQDAKRTGRSVVALIHDRLAARQLVKRKAWPKKSGSLGTPVGELNLPKFE